MIVGERLTFFNQAYNFTYKRIFVRDNRSRWGSCSAAGNLNFNLRLTLLPPELQDYVVIHELCHLGELNHSPRFWALVARTQPHFKKIRKILRLYHISRLLFPQKHD